MRLVLACMVGAVLLAAARPAFAEAPISGPPQFQGDVSSARAATTRAHDLLAYLTLPPTATAVDATPLLPALHDRPASNLVVRSRWWSVPMTSAALAEWLEGHIPYGFWAPKRSTSAGGAVGLAYSSQATYPSYTTIDVTYLQVGGRVDVRVDGVVTWLPPRPPTEQIPLSTPVVEVVVTSGRQHKVLKRVAYRGVPGLSKLIPWLDFAAGYPPGQAACPGAGDGQSTRLTFRIGHRVVVFSWADGGCDVVDVTVNGRPSVPLAGRPTDLVDYLVGLG